MGYKKLDNELYEKWDEILENLRVNYDISMPAFKTFIKILKIYSISGHHLTVLIDNDNYGSNKSFIEKKYHTFLQVSIEEITGIHYEITYISKNEVKDNTPVENYSREISKTRNHGYSRSARL